MLLNFKKNIVILLIWLFISLIIAIISTILAVMRVVDINNPDKSIYIFICAIVCFIILGFLSGNIHQKKGLYNSISLSIFVIIIFSLINYLGFEDKYSYQILPKYFALVLSSGLGGVFGVNFKSLIK